MTLITSLDLTSSEQHIEMGKERRKTDQADEKKKGFIMDSKSQFIYNFRIIKWVTKGTSSGIIADESTSVDCDKAESIGQDIQEHFHGIELEQAKVKRKDRITTIDTITHGIMVDGKQITIKPKVLFTRLTAMYYINFLCIDCQLICFCCQHFFDTTCIIK